MTHFLIMTNTIKIMVLWLMYACTLFEVNISNRMQNEI